MILPELRGRAGDLEVRVQSLPCRVDELGRRRYPWRDFGCEFLEELGRRLPPFEQVRAALPEGTLAVELHLGNQAPIQVELRGRPPTSRRFDSDLADALIEAFRSAQLEP